MSSQIEASDTPRPTTNDHTGVSTSHPRLRRSRWAALGAATAVALGAGGLGLAGASSGEPSGVVTIAPERILDTRNGIGLDGPFSSRSSRTLQVTGAIQTPGGNSTVVPEGATGVILNVTAVQPTADGFISVRPDGTPGAPETSNLNFAAGDIIPNSVTVALSASGAVEITYDAFSATGPTTDILVDVTGFLAENDVYTTAESDARYASKTDLATKGEPAEVVATEAGSLGNLDPMRTANSETFTTTIDGKLHLTMRGEMYLQCDLSDLAVYYLVVNGEPVASSLTAQIQGGFEGILFGATDDVVPAGEHEVAMGARCWQAGANPGPHTVGDYSNVTVLVVP